MSTATEIMPAITALPIVAPVSASSVMADAYREDSASTSVANETARLVKNAKLMIVDDEPINIMVSRKYLTTAGYSRFVTISDPTQAMETIAAERPDLLILDIMMPKVSGLELLLQVRQIPSLAHMPVLILTASTDPATKSQALELGATDFLLKPVDASDLLPRVRNALVVKAQQDHLARYAEQLEEQVRKRTSQLAIAKREVIECLAFASEYRDTVTGHHVVRVGKYAAAIAKGLGMPPAVCELIDQAAQLHDVGKIAIPDSILQKPGKLTSEEFRTMQRHCRLGQAILLRLSVDQLDRLQRDPKNNDAALSSRSSTVIRMAAEISISHHEWYDGTGYPRGLVGDKIPLSGRITTIADVFDALSSKRPYKAPIPLEECLEIMAKSRGTQFDPKVFDAFLKVQDRIVEIRKRYSD